MEEQLIINIMSYKKYDGKSNEEYEKATECHLCNKQFEKKYNNQKVLDHDHLTGAYRGAAHR